MSHPTKHIFSILSERNGITVKELSHILAERHGEPLSEFVLDSWIQLNAQYYRRLDKSDGRLYLTENGKQYLSKLTA